MRKKDTEGIKVRKLNSALNASRRINRRNRSRCVKIMHPSGTFTGLAPFQKTRLISLSQRDGCLAYDSIGRQTAKSHAETHITAHKA